MTDPNKLTPKEIEVLREIVKGASNKKIAELLVVSERTIHSHMSKILSKLNCENRHEIIVKYFKGEFKEILGETKNDDLGVPAKIHGFLDIKIGNDGIPRVFTVNGEQVLGIRKLELKFEVDNVFVGTIEFIANSIQIEGLRAQINE